MQISLGARPFLKLSNLHVTPLLISNTEVCKVNIKDFVFMCYRLLRGKVSRDTRHPI